MAHARLPSAPDGPLSHVVSDANRVLLVEKNGKLHHPFPRTIAPYPLSHERAVTDADALDLAFRLHLFDGSPSAIPLIRLDDPSTHPRRCLDLGCGSGEWIITAAKLWPHTKFVGLDLVSPQVSLVDTTSLWSNQASLHSPTTLLSTNPNVHPTLGASTLRPLADRIEWVQANFLRILPFYAGEFDYIRLSGIARGVPEDKWDSLLSEISRVLAVNGHLEIEEEDVIFPILPSSDLPTEPSSDPAFTRRPFETPGHANLSKTTISKRSYRTSTSSSFCCVGDEDEEDGMMAIPEASLSPHTAQKNSPSSPSTRRLSLSANRFLAAAAPNPPPPVPSLSINTRIMGISAAKEDSPILQRPPVDFPFELASEPTATSKPLASPGHGSIPPRRRTNDPAIPPGWEGPIVHSAPNSAATSQFPIPSKPARTSRRPKTASTIASTIMSSMTPKASKSDGLRRPSSAGANRRQGNGSADASWASVPPLPISSRNPSSISTHPDSPTKKSWKTVFSSKPRPSRSTVSPPSNIPGIPIQPLASLTQRANVRHDHQVLKTLFFSVFESRFINTSPTAILPSLLNTYFQGVSVTPPIDFPVPPLPSVLKEVCRREKRNITQREWGRCGLEVSQTANLSIIRSPGDLRHAVSSSKGLGLERALHTRALLQPETSEGKQLKKSRSSPALASRKRTSMDQHYPLARPFTPQSGINKRSESPSLTLSSATSSSASIPTPTSAIHQIPRVQPIPEYNASSPLSVQSPHSPIPRSKDEEEDAKFAIMGDGGCFPLDSPTTPSTQPSTGVVFDSTASISTVPETHNKRSMDNDTISHLSGWGRPSVDVLTCEEEEALNNKDLREFDHVAAQELGVFDGVFGPDIIKAAYDPRALRQERVYVRPRGTFAGHGMPVPPALLEMDDLSMGVHLTRCWTNVMACKEAMWEELQRRAEIIHGPEESMYGEKARSNAHTMRRVTLLDQVEWVGTERRLSDRDKFDLLFLRFEDDMRHWASIGTELRGKLSWIDPRFAQHGPVPHPPLRSKPSLSVFNPSRRPSEAPSLQSTLVSGSSILTSSSASTTAESPTVASISSPIASVHSGNGAPLPSAGQVRYGWDDGRGPGKDGIVVPGVDICRTLRIFTARKAADTRDPGGNAMKIMSVL